MCHIRELTTLLGCDWYLLSTSYTFHVHFIHIKGVFNTLYAVDGHRDTTSTCMAMARARFMPCFTSGNQPHCLVVIGTSYPLHTNGRSTSYILKVFFILYMQWMVIRIQPQPVWAGARVKPCFTSGNQPHCSVVIGTSYPLHTHVRST